MPGSTGASGTAGMFTGGPGGGYGTGTSVPTTAGQPGAGINPLFLLMGVQSLGTAATSYAQARALESEGAFKASVYESNKKIQELKAKDAIRRGDVEAKKAKQAAARLIGSQRAAMGAQGIDIESGSALDIQEETASLGAEDALNIKNNAWREAWGYRTVAEDYSSKAKFARLTSKSKARNTILTGGLSIAKDLARASYLSNRTTTLEDYLSGGF